MELRQIYLNLAIYITLSVEKKNIVLVPSLARYFYCVSLFTWILKLFFTLTKDKRNHNTSHSVACQAHPMCQTPVLTENQLDQHCSWNCGQAGAKTKHEAKAARKKRILYSEECKEQLLLNIYFYP